MAEDTAAETSGEGTPRIPAAASSSASPSAEQNAFTKLMSKKHKTTPPPNPKRSMFNRRDGLGVYIDHPEKTPKSQLVFYDDAFVGINDLYPKSSVHCLLLPRSPTHQHQHPFDALEDAAFLATVRASAAKLKTLVAKELQRKYARFSAQEKAREAVLNGDVELAAGEELPPGRDWEGEVRVGIHAHPSMNHLHIHVLSVDRCSERMKHTKHYNSFATPFFVELDAFPLADDDERRYPDKMGYLKRSLECWRCGKDFGKGFAKLKGHLEQELEEWKRE